MKTVAYCDPLVPSEWIAAHKLRPVWVVPRDDRASAESGPLTGECPYARAVIDTLASCDEDTLAVLTTTCDQMRRGAGLLVERRAESVFLLNVPATRDSSASRDYYTAELHRLGRWLVDHGGRPPTSEQLAQIMVDHDAARADFRRGRLPAEEPSWCNPVAVELAALSNAMDDEGIALGLVGGPLRRRDLAIARWIHASGGRIVLDATDGGCRTLPEPFEPSAVAADPLAELARAYFEGGPAVFDRPNRRFVEWLAQHVEQYNVRGLLFVRHVWCDPWHAALARLKETLGIPILEIDLGDEDQGGEGRIGQRLDALIESLC